MDMKLIKEAFSKPSRELSARVTIGGKEFTDEHLERIKVVTGLSEGKDFSVGTAFMSSATIKLVDKYENFNEGSFKDKTAVVEIGVKTSQDIGYAKLGEFIIGSVSSNVRSWELKSYDLMSKFNVKYDCRLNFPCSLKDLVLDICKICGVSASDSIKNSNELNRKIKFKPNFYDMTAREVLAQVAELVCGWAYIDAISQKLEIGSYGNADDIKINDDNIVVFKEFKNTSNTDSKIQIDSVRVIQNGAADADYNKDGDKKFHIVDNMFIQGNGIDFIDVGKKSFKFNELSALSIKYNGNPALGVGKAVTVVRDGKSFEFLPLVRKLTYNGGLVEECECPQINYDPAKRKQDIVRHVEKINALLRVMDDKIQSKVGTEEFSTLVEQTKEEIKALAKNINLTGYVKFEDLKKVNNSTIINGGNITTGVIQSKDGGFGIDLDNKTFFLGRDLEHYALLFDGKNLKFGSGGIKSEHFSEGLKQELKGQDGQSQYVHTRYSDSPGTTGAMYVEPSSNSGEPHKYIGFAITSSKGAPALKSEYKWSKYIGEDGTNGTPGKTGADGKTPYFHVAWADSPGGSEGFTTSGGTNKKYMGTYTDFTKEDSTSFSKYKWVKVKGDDGEDGRPGQNGKDGKSFKYNLISNGDFHVDFTKNEPGHKPSVLNTWQVKDSSAASKMYVSTTDKEKIPYLHVNADADDTIEINQYLALKKNTKYYIKAYVASKKMCLYYKGGEYKLLDDLADKFDYFRTIRVSFETHDTDTHAIQLDCRGATQVRYILLSEEPIPHGTDWYPSHKDTVGVPGPQGPPGPPGPPGRDGSLVDLPAALKAWNSNATEISGKYVFTPELFVGEGSYSNKTGIYIGKNVRLYDDLAGGYRSYSGMMGLENGKLNWIFTDDGNFRLGKKWDEMIMLGADGRAIIPKAKIDEAEINKLIANEIKSTSINTDMLIPGANNRIVMERGYSPGSNNAMSIDANGNAIRLKYSGGTYVRVDSGGVSLYKDGDIRLATARDAGISVDHGRVAEEGDFSTYMSVSRQSDFKAVVEGSWVLSASSEGAWARGFHEMSDFRLKENVVKLDNPDITLKPNPKSRSDYVTESEIIDFVKNTNLFNYNFKFAKKPCFSMMAQSAKGKIKELLVCKNSDGNESIELYNYTSLLHQAIKNLFKRNDELESRVKTLEEEMKEIKNLIKKEGEGNA